MSSSIVTGAAGFIGSHLSEQLLKLGENVVGIDNFDPWYDPKTKETNLSAVTTSESFSLFRENVLSMDLTEILKPGDVIYHLAARPGVQDSWGSGFAASVENNVLVNLFGPLFESGLKLCVKIFIFCNHPRVVLHRLILEYLLQLNEHVHLQHQIGEYC